MKFLQDVITDRIVEITSEQKDMDLFNTLVDNFSSRHWKYFPDPREMRSLVVNLQLKANLEKKMEEEKQNGNQRNYLYLVECSKIMDEEIRKRAKETNIEYEKAVAIFLEIN